VRWYDPALNVLTAFPVLRSYHWRFMSSVARPI
jgi:hypothetical protein